MHAVSRPRLPGTPLSQLGRYQSSISLAHPYPFPRHAHPTPHQIFHLPSGATQQDVKTRYFDLVKIYHPDSPHCRDIPLTVRYARFQSVMHAYGVLREKSTFSRGELWNDPVRAELERRRRRASSDYAQHPATGGNRGPRAKGFAYDFPPSADGRDGRAKRVDGWNDQRKDKVLICATVLAVGAAVFPSIVYISPTQIESRHKSASSNLAEARAEARVFGRERRTEIRRRVQENKERERREEEARIESSLTLPSPEHPNNKR